jgi:hypothetical protein
MVEEEATRRYAEEEVHREAREAERKRLREMAAKTCSRRTWRHDRKMATLESWQVK